MVYTKLIMRIAVMWTSGLVVLLALGKSNRAVSSDEMTAKSRHSVEDEESWNLYVQRQLEGADNGHRMLKRKHKRKKEVHHYDVERMQPYLGRTKYNGGDIRAYEEQQEVEYLQHQKRIQDEKQLALQKSKQEFEERLENLYEDPGIDAVTVHGLMIDAGSTGSRMHIYEWQPRVLRNEQDVQDAVAGNKLSFPGTDSRWTERLRPGLASFGSIENDVELQKAVANYLAPLLDFAKTVLHTKHESWGDYPIYLRATAGMRILDTRNRARVTKAVRDLFSNATHCPFAFVPEQARVLSGEEEAIYDWAGVNFLTGNLIEQSEGLGTVINPRHTHGALDLGGGSTQISFYESKEDIMANLFKLQIGQGKHWSVYAHSFLYYGMNEALNRFQARLSANKSSHERLVQGIYNPCLPGKTRVDFRSDIHILLGSESGTIMETWNYTQIYPSGDGSYQAILKNDDKRGSPQECLDLTKDLLHLEQNQWCKFDHNGECSFAGVYQPALPTPSDSFGEFLAFSNYYHVWRFLQLPERATIAQLENATRHVCSLSWDELVDFAPAKYRKDGTSLESYCFRSSYVYQLLHSGFGFQNDHVIRAVQVISGHKVGWALGAMLYEINTLPWKHETQSSKVQHGKSHESTISDDDDDDGGDDIAIRFLMVTFIATMLMLVAVFVQRERRRSLYKRYAQYEPVKDVAVTKTLNV